MVTPAGNEFVVKVRLDGRAAARDSEKVAKDSATKAERAVKKTLRRNLLGGLATTLGFFFGGVAGQAGRETAALGDIVGRGTRLGGEAGQFFGKFEAQRTALDRTVDAFGLSGGRRGEALDPNAVLGFFKQQRALEELRTGTEARVREIVGNEIRNEILESVAKDLGFAAKEMKLVAQKFNELFIKGALR